MTAARQGADDSSGPAPPAKPKLLVRVRMAIVARHYSPRTASAYTGWIRRFILFHDTRRPETMGVEEIAAFLSNLATQHRVSASTQNQAKAAIQFSYREVLDIELPRLGELVVAKRLHRRPVLLTRSEVTQVLFGLQGVPRLVGTLLHGAGLRLVECLQLREQDVDFLVGSFESGAARAGAIGWQCYPRSCIAP